MAGSFFVVPQWQGSGSSRAMQLIDGTEAIQADLPSSATQDVPVPLGAGSDQGSGVRRLSSLLAVRDSLRGLLAQSDSLPIVIGGDCGIELASIEKAAASGRLAVVWFDAHADLNTPESSPSGAFHGMVLRTLLGDGEESLLPEVPLEASQVILAGVRAIDPGESSFIDERGIRRLSGQDLSPASLADALVASGADAVYLHIDLDVLDPGEFGGLGFPEPFGVTVAELVALIREAKATLPLVGAGITEFAPSSPAQADNDLPAILRIIGALSS